MSEFGEPWVFEQFGEVCNTARETVFNSGENYEAGMLCANNDTLKRVVSCVNFLAGVPTDDLDIIRKMLPSAVTCIRIEFRNLAEMLRNNADEIEADVEVGQ